MMIIRKIAYAIILFICLVLIGLAEFFTAGFNTDIFTQPAFWFTISACALANYIMVVYTAIEKIDDANIKNKDVKEKKENLDNIVDKNVDTDFDDYLSLENRERKVKAWKKKISNKIARLDERTRDADREILWYGSEEDKRNNRYCRKRNKLLEKLTDEYINRNIAFLKVKYVRIRRYEITHGCKQSNDDYRITTRKYWKVIKDNLPKVMQSMAFIIVMTTFTFAPKEVNAFIFISFIIKFGSLFLSIYNGIAYGNNFISGVILPDLQYRLNTIISYMNWKLKKKEENR